MVIPLFVGRPKSIKALDVAMDAGKHILLVAQKQAAKDDPARRGPLRHRQRRHGPADAEAARRHREGAGRGHAARAASRASSEHGELPRRRGAADAAGEPGTAHEVEAMRRALLAQFDQYVKLNKKIPPEILTSMSGHRRRRPPGRHDRRAPAAQARAEAADPRDERRRASASSTCSALLEGEIDILQVEKRIRGRVKRQMEKSQREYYLNEQVKAIQKELGEGDENADLEEMEKKIKAAQMSKEAEGKAMAELKKLQDDVADVGRSDGRAQLHRHAARPAVAQEEQDQQGPRARGQGARRRSLRPREGQGAHRRVPRGAAARRQAEGADPVPRRPARRRQDVARPVDREGDQPQVRAHVRSAACATRPRSAAIAAPTSARCPARSCRT